MGRNQVFISLALVISLRASPANAFCRSPGPPSEEFWKAFAVFHGTVVSIHHPSPGWSFTDGGSRITINVEESFKGTSSGLVDVFAVISGDGPHFVVGRHYFVYVSRHQISGRLVVHCERERLFEEAAEDLEYARLAVSHCAPSEIFGRMTHWNPRARTDNEFVTASRNVPVTLRSETGNEWTTSSNEDGCYSFSGLSDGHYTIEIAAPHGTYSIGTVEPLSLQVGVARVCRTIDFLLTWDGRVRGRVMTAGGNPVSAFVVALQRQADKGWDARSAAIIARTDDDGRFEVNHLPSGEYRLGWDLQTSPYYGTELRDGSPTLGMTLGEGERLLPLDFILPGDMSVGELVGTVVTRYGNPIEGASISVQDSDGAPLVNLKTDSAGTFNARVIQGRRYRVRAEVRSTGRVLRVDQTIDVIGSTTVLLLTLTAPPSE